MEWLTLAGIGAGVIGIALLLITLKFDVQEQQDKDDECPYKIDRPEDLH